MTGALLNQMKDGFQRAFRLALEQKEMKPRVSLNYAHVYVTVEEQEQLQKQIFELVKPYETRRGIEGEIEVPAFLITYPQVVPGADSSKATFLTTENTQIVGSVTYDRKGLEQLLAEKKRLHVNIIGVCHIDEDVDAGLAERAFEYFHIVGTLIASDHVHEVLNAKG